MSNFGDSGELYVVTPDGIAVTHRVHAAVLVCVKTAAIMGAVLALGPLKEEEYNGTCAITPRLRLEPQHGCCTQARSTVPFPEKDAALDG